MTVEHIYDDAGELAGYSDGGVVVADDSPAGRLLTRWLEDGVPGVRGTYDPETETATDVPDLVEPEEPLFGLALLDHLGELGWSVGGAVVENHYAPLERWAFADEITWNKFNPLQPRAHDGKWVHGGSPFVARQHGRVSAPDPADTTQVGGKLKGGTGAVKVQDKDGKFWSKKTAENTSEGHLLEEAAADRVYRKLGVAAPNSAIVHTTGGAVKMAEWVHGEDLGDWYAHATPAQQEAAHAELRKNFALDALLGNWDVIGLNHDNVKVTPDGQVVRIDNGGALRYRAGGQKKASWGKEVTELEGMRDKKLNPTAAGIFGKLTDAEVAEQMHALLGKREQILAAVKDPALKKLLGERLDYMQERLDAGYGGGGKATAGVPKLTAADEAKAAALAAEMKATSESKAKLGGLLAPPGSLESLKAVHSLTAKQLAEAGTLTGAKILQMSDDITGKFGSGVGMAWETELAKEHGKPGFVSSNDLAALMVAKLSKPTPEALVAAAQVYAGKTDKAAAKEFWDNLSAEGKTGLATHLGLPADSKGAAVWEAAKAKHGPKPQSPLDAAMAGAAKDGALHTAAMKEKAAAGELTGVTLVQLKGALDAQYGNHLGSDWLQGLAKEHGLSPGATANEIAQAMNAKYGNKFVDSPAGAKLAAGLAKMPSEFQAEQFLKHLTDKEKADLYGHLQVAGGTPAGLWEAAKVKTGLAAKLKADSDALAAGKPAAFDAHAATQKVKDLINGTGGTAAAKEKVEDYLAGLSPKEFYDFVVEHHGVDAGAAGTNYLAASKLVEKLGPEVSPAAFPPKPAAPPATSPQGTNPHHTGAGLAAYIKSKAAEHGVSGFSDLQLSKIEQHNSEGVKNGVVKVTSLVKSKPELLAHLQKVLPAGTVIKAISKADAEALVKGVPVTPTSHPTAPPAPKPAAANPPPSPPAAPAQHAWSTKNSKMPAQVVADAAKYAAKYYPGLLASGAPAPSTFALKSIKHYLKFSKGHPVKTVVKVKSILKDVQASHPSLKAGPTSGTPATVSVPPPPPIVLPKPSPNTPTFKGDKSFKDKLQAVAGYLKAKDVAPALAAPSDVSGANLPGVSSAEGKKALDYLVKTGWKQGEHPVPGTAPLSAGAGAVAAIQSSADFGTLTHPGAKGVIEAAVAADPKAQQELKDFYGVHGASSPNSIAKSALAYHGYEPTHGAVSPPPNVPPPPPPKPKKVRTIPPGNLLDLHGAKIPEHLAHITPTVTPPAEANEGHTPSGWPKGSPGGDMTPYLPPLSDNAKVEAPRSPLWDVKTNNEWNDSLTPAEIGALSSWKGHSGAVRRGFASDKLKQLDPHSEQSAIVSAILKAPPHEGVLYRGISQGPYKYVDQLIAAAKEGGFYVDDAPPGFTPNVGKAHGFAGGDLVVRAHVKTARPIHKGDHSFLATGPGKEMEVLGLPGKKYKVKGVYQNVKFHDPATGGTHKVKWVLDVEEV